MSFAALPSVDVGSLPADALLIDVREDDEWSAGHAEGALHVPMSAFVDRFGEVSEAVSDGRTAYVVCRSGGRSAQVTQYLVQQGVDAVNVDGGMMAWDGAGRPLVSDNGSATVL
ncbi:rhodanese-like domain-containing protein [Streptomyces sp. NRRL F-5126]|uniref:rhodanese-like domain-containing protein n=1 Tax=Streptomyces sp. NRRL F-5126 TaxID=1463857 RepID=UPI0004CBC5B6|nr:rhodanese-like domain-containing protein [Streptomyces sp. NRRL F-5126]